MQTWRTCSELEDLEELVHDSILLGAFQIALQPICRIPDRTPEAYEALLRPPNNYPPQLFLAVADEIGELTDLELAIFKKIRGILSSKQSKTIFINLTESAFCKPRTFIPVLGDTADRVILELQERKKVPAIIHAAKIWRKHGFRIAIDDFGDNLVDVGLLTNLAPTYVKIGPSISAPGLKHVLAKTIKVAHSYGALVIVEGIETEEQYRVVCECKTDFVQGYLTGRPFLSTSMEARSK